MDLRVLLEAIEGIRDELPDLIGEAWPEFEAKLLHYLHEIESAADDVEQRTLQQAFLIRHFRTQPAAMDRLREEVAALRQDDPPVTRGIPAILRRLIGELEADPPEEPAPRDLPDGEPAPDFNAYPRLDAPEEVAPDARFTLVVGFRAEADPTLEEVQPLSLVAPAPDTELLVVLVAEGAEFEAATGAVRSSHQVRLPLRLEAAEVLDLRVRSGAREVVIKAQYWYGADLVGGAVRRVRVTGASASSEPEPDEEDNPCRLSNPPGDSEIDLTVTVLRAGEGKLVWRIASASPERQIGPLECQIGNPREFAAQLDPQLGATEDYQGAFADNTLRNLGQEIADRIPAAFFTTLLAVHAAVGRPPQVLIVTDEPYVPWELAYLHEDRRLDPSAPPFLAAQCLLGRWWLDNHVVQPPPTELPIHTLTAVASLYGGFTGQRELTEAVAEREALVAHYRALGCEALLTEIEEHLLRRPVAAGHLLHVAAHGFSHPDANEQALLLADKKRLTARAMAPPHRCGAVPPYAFVFFNACQVGTAGSSLGQAAGFPGILIRGGALGFIAPLWKVHDTAARRLAERFYKATLSGDESVGGALRDERTRYVTGESLTPLAYIYYGHPAMRLAWRPPEE